MQDSVAWLSVQGRDREAMAIDKVLEYRLRSAAAGLRLQFDPDNIEELFSLSSAEVGAAMSKEMVVAMAATLDYSRSIAVLPVTTQWVDTSLVTRGASDCDACCHSRILLTEDGPAFPLPAGSGPVPEYLFA